MPLAAADHISQLVWIVGFEFPAFGSEHAATTVRHRRGEVIARGTNCVTSRNDPTAHAEITAIREACRKLRYFSLAECELYTSCEPCPMCLAAIYWARIPKLYYGNTRADAAAIGFDDDFIYQQIPLPPEKRSIAMQPLLRDEAQEAFREWQAKPDKVEY